VKARPASKKVKALMDYLEGTAYRVMGYDIPKHLVEAIFRMPKVGKRLSYSQARAKQIERCIRDGQVNFDPATENIVSWATRNGYYIEFEEGELEF